MNLEHLRVITIIDIPPVVIIDGGRRLRMVGVPVARSPGAADWRSVAWSLSQSGELRTSVFQVVALIDLACVHTAHSHHFRVEPQFETSYRLRHRIDSAAYGRLHIAADRQRCVHTVFLEHSRL
jgi:hypothetical protein